MQVAPLTTLASMPSVGMIMGTMSGAETFGSTPQYQHSINTMDSELDRRFKQFEQQFVSVADTTMAQLQTARVILDTGFIIPDIVSREALLHVPEMMQDMLINYTPMKEYLNQEVIHGWGIDPTTLPEEDPYANQLAAGLTECDAEGKWPEYTDWTVTTEDLDLSSENLNSISESRRWIHQFIEDQLESDLEDPTDYIEGGLLGELPE